MFDKVESQVDYAFINSNQLKNNDIKNNIDIVKDYLEANLDLWQVF